MRSLAGDEGSSHEDRPDRPVVRRSGTVRECLRRGEQGRSSRATRWLSCWPGPPPVTSSRPKARPKTVVAAGPRPAEPRARISRRRSAASWWPPSAASCFDELTPQPPTAPVRRRPGTRLPHLPDWLTDEDSAVPFVLALVDHEGGDVRAIGPTACDPDERGHARRRHPVRAQYPRGRLGPSALPAPGGERLAAATPPTWWPRSTTGSSRRRTGRCSPATRSRASRSGQLLGAIRRRAGPA